MRQAPAVRPGHDKYFLSTHLLHIITQFGFHKRRRFSFQAVLEAGAIHHGCFLDETDHLLARIKPVPFIVHHQAQVRAAHSKGVHLAVQFLVLERGGFHVSVGANALDADLFTQ